MWFIVWSLVSLLSLAQSRYLNLRTGLIAFIAIVSPPVLATAFPVWYLAVL